MAGRDPPLAIVWEFRIRPGAEAAFEAAYGPRGAWAELFAGGEGYLGTELLRDARSPGRYLTVDRWASAADHARFREAHAGEYARLDERLAALTEAELELGSFLVP